MTKLERRRARARELRAEGLSIRDIAERLRVGRSTIARDLVASEPERLPVPGIQDEHGRPVAGAEADNTLALAHGCYSPRTIAPVREEHGRVLAERYSWLDPGRRATEAQRRAMIELAAGWIDRQGTVVKDGEGRTFDIAVKLAAWLGQSERWTERAEDERREQSKYDALAELLDHDERGDDVGA